MGLFGKKEACPVCGGEVKGLVHKKIGGKKALCKDCSAQVSMHEELLKTDGIYARLYEKQQLEKQLEAV